MTDWRNILDSQKCPKTHAHYPQNRIAQEIFEDIDDFEDSKLESKDSGPWDPGEGPCQRCGCRLWFRDSMDSGPWQCRRCVEPGPGSWKELLYVPEGWRPLKAGEPGLAFLCPSCQKAVSTLLFQQPTGWTCSACVESDHPFPLPELRSADSL